MKKFFALFFWSFWVAPALAGEIKAFFSYAAFNTPTQQPYLETYLTVAGNSVVFSKLNNGKFQGKIEVSIALFKKDTAFTPKKYFLLSPEISDTANRPAFIDLQRLSVSYGTYALEVSISDANSKNKTKHTITEKIEINFPENSCSLSDIQLIESYKKTISNSILSKSGYDLIPFPAGIYPDGNTTLSFYAEAYNTEKSLGIGERFAFFYFIENLETKQKVESFAGFQKQTTAGVNVILSQLDVSKLKNGNYLLSLEVRDKNNQTITNKKIPFARKTSTPKSELSELSAFVTENTFIAPVTHPDTLEEYIRCLWPVSSTSEREYATNQILNRDVKQMQKYIYGFWKLKNPNDPEGEWKKYKRNVDQVNQIFASGKIKGYATDRGRVYLQYGTPDARQEFLSEANSYPYEIWQYYRINDPATGQLQTNKRFIFCNNELAGNNYQLIHSEARGEKFDARWRLKIMKRTVQSMNLDFEKPGGTFGNGVDENFATPK
jgi:GWxTD domain-containing protein